MKKSSRLIQFTHQLTQMFLLIISVSLFSCSAMTGRTTGEVVDDMSLTSEINSIIVGDKELKYFKINVDSTQGNVILSGFVPNQKSGDRLVHLSKEVKGVKTVKNELKVEHN